MSSHCFDHTTETNTKFIKSLSNQCIDDLIKNLKDETDQFTEEKEIPSQFDKYKDLFYCWITPINYKNISDDNPQIEQSQSSHISIDQDENIESSVINEQTFLFAFYLWIYHKDITYKFKFKSGWKQFTKLYNDKQHQLCFTDQPFPKRVIHQSPETRNKINELLKKKLNNLKETDLWYLSQQQQAEENNMETAEYILANIDNQLSRMGKLANYAVYNVNDIGRGPGWESNWKWNTKKKKATEQDAHNAAYVLCKIFNCPQLMLTANFFSHFGDEFEDEMQKVLQILAHTSVQHLRFIGYNWQHPKEFHYAPNLELDTGTMYWQNKNEYRNLYKLKEQSVCVYHRVYVMKKMLKSFHWALKFVGFDKLLTIEYFNNSRVYVQSLDNNVMGQKIFWYGDASDIEHCTFTKRWNIIHKQNLDPMISGSQIGHWIDLWFIENPKYHPLTNNCQHFARDIMSAIDRNAGRSLIDKMQRLKVNRSIWPSNTKNQEIKQTIEISKKLKLYGMLKHCQFKKADEYYVKLKEFDIEKLKTLDHDEVKSTILIGHQQRYLENTYMLMDPLEK